MSASAIEVLADPSRRRVVEALQEGEKPVNAIVKVVGINQSGVSRHLRILAEAGFVTMRSEGQQRFYTLKPEPFWELNRWTGAFLREWDRRLDRFELELHRRTLRNESDPRGAKER